MRYGKYEENVYEKMLALVLAVVMTCSGLTGCSRGGKEPSEGTQVSKTSETEKQEEAKAERPIKETLKIALAYDITSLDSHIGKEMRACVISQQIFDTLVEWDPQGGIGSEIVPCLATAWEYLSDTSVQFKLRE